MIKNRNFNNSLTNCATFFIVKKSQTVLIFKLVTGTSFAFIKILRVLVNMYLLLMMEMVAESNTHTHTHTHKHTHTPNFVTSSQDIHSEFVKSGIDLKNSSRSYI